MHYAKITALILILALTMPFALSYDPARFISRNSYLLRENEAVERIIEVRLNNEDYYVAQIKARDRVTGYIALRTDESSVVREQTKSKHLFQTAHFIELYSGFKQRVSDNPAYIWFILQHSQVPSLVHVLENTERFELELIEGALQTTEGSRIVSDLTRELDSMIAGLKELQSEMIKTNSFESDFLNKPQAGQEEDLKEKLVTAFEKLDSVHRQKSNYNSLLSHLKGEIGTHPDLTFEEKRSLSNAANLPEAMKQIDRWHSSAMSMHFRENIETVYKGAVETSSDFATGISWRIKRDRAYSLVFEENERLKRETNNDLITLQGAFDILTDDRYYEEWVEQQHLSNFENQWRAVQTYLNREDYDNAQKSAEQALNSAIAVYRGGFREPETGFDFNQLFMAIGIIMGITAIVLIGILGIKYLRGKKQGLFSGKNGGKYEEVKLQ